MLAICGNSLAAADDLAVPPALYAGGIVAIVTKAASGAWPQTDVLAACVLAAWAVYALDRVKLRDTLADPADAAAHPRRAARMRSARTGVRVGIVLATLGAVWLAIGAHAWLAGVLLLGLPAALIYAGLPARTQRAHSLGLLPAPGRFKDSVFKPLLIAGGHTMLSASAALACGADLLAVVLCAGMVAAVVAADAALCDIDDADTDIYFGTPTLVSAAGRRRTMAAGLAMSVIGSIGLACMAGIFPHGWAVPAMFAVWMALTTPVVFIQRGRLKALVDMRLPLCVALAWIAVEVAR